MTKVNRPPYTAWGFFRGATANQTLTSFPGDCNPGRNTWLDLLLPCLTLSAALLLAGCGGSMSFPGSSKVSVTASPSSTTIVSGNTRQFTAKVMNTSNTAVTWSATAGTVSASGLFTAPSVSSATEIDVTATSKADSSKSATVVLTVSPTNSPAVVAALAVSPPNLRFAGQVGSASVAPASVSITNTGAGKLSFTGTSDQPWLVLSAASGTAPFTLNVTPSIGSLKAGTYSGHVMLTAGGITKTVPVVLTITTASAAATSPVQHSVSLTWKPSTNPRTISYSMYRSTITGGSYGLLASALGIAIYSDRGVQSGTTYYYVVTAVDNAGKESSYSNQIRVAIP
jgi:Viral BACON domain